MSRFFDCSKITRENYKKYLKELNKYKPTGEVREGNIYDVIDSFFKKSSFREAMTEEGKQRFRIEEVFGVYVNNIIKDFERCSTFKSMFDCTRIDSTNYHNFMEDLNKLKSEFPSTSGIGTPPYGMLYTIKENYNFYQSMTDYGKRFLDDMGKKLYNIEEWNDQSIKILKEYIDMLISNLKECFSRKIYNF